MLPLVKSVHLHRHVLKLSPEPCCSLFTCGWSAQIQRLLELQSYLTGGISDWPTPAAEPLVKQELAQVTSNNIDFSTAADPQLPSVPKANTPGLARLA